MKTNLGITTPDYFCYLSQSQVYKVDGTNDAHEFQETLRGSYVVFYLRNWIILGTFWLYNRINICYLVGYNNFLIINSVIS